jgi:hypothetical protein
MFKESKPKEGPRTAELFNDVARAIAVCSFFPGGIELFGTRYETGPEFDGYEELAERLQRKRKPAKRKTKLVGRRP